MAKAKKFGTFSGVFVPSLLTILGVIMYLRLGWVVGESGLLASLGIVFVAHIISVTTGLSVSSVATDKKVKAGGLYYMLSRSLGLPIGGSIGITLFLGTALSIALYVVGFSDSFNNAIGFRAEGLLGTRITGTITLSILTAIALISTSIALKTQIYIMVAIFLSLVSIFVGGFFGDHGLLASTPAIGMPADGVSLVTIFAIFFPAVTGFTAGVAMSGDLKDPKRAIPMGTMASIGVGLLVYILFTFFLAYTIDADALRADYNILSKIALFSAYGAPFVMAGIWGATLSSAVGGILGAPRILQAMSDDKVTPKFFAKGAGQNNEPHRALLLTFLLAEIGVLLGELDLIARVVSMFYLTAYGFINLTSALESWSGSDFRPQFKIPRAVSILGAVATFVVMFQLDFVAMLAAFLIIALIFLILTRKQITIGFSDVWQGVWSEVLKTALHKISGKKADQRNWRPNILLFSGEMEKRKYMYDFGQSLVSRLGVVSAFELKEDKQTTGIMPLKSAVLPSDNEKGLFSRSFLCADVYDGIATLVATYGFSGLMPNTVLMGWSRYAGAPYRFSRLLRHFNRIDYNVLIMDYDRKNGFGKKDRIDIWFKGKGRNLSFALTIVRFLTSSDSWHNARIRILTDLEKTTINAAEIYKNMEAVLENMRLDATVKIVSSSQKNATFLETLEAESKDAALVMLGLSEVREGKEQAFYVQTDQICSKLGSVLLYSASSDFREIDLGIPAQTGAMNLENTALTEPQEELRILVTPTFPRVADQLELLHAELEGAVSLYFSDYFQIVLAKDQVVYKLMSECLQQLQAKIGQNAPSSATLRQFVSDFFEENAGLLRGYIGKEVEAQSNILAEGNKVLLQLIREITEKIGPKIPILLSKKDYSAAEKQKFRRHLGKTKWLLSGKKFTYRPALQKMVAAAVQKFQAEILVNWMSEVLNEGIKIQSALQKVVSQVQSSLIKAESLASEDTKIPADTTEELLTHTAEALKIHLEAGKIQASKSKQYLLHKLKDALQEVADHIEEVSIPDFFRNTPSRRLNKTRLYQKITEDIPQKWQKQRTLYFNFLYLEYQIKAFELSFEAHIKAVCQNLEQNFQDKILLKVRSLAALLEQLSAELADKDTLEQPENLLSEFQNLEHGEWLFGLDDALEENLPHILRHFPEEIELSDLSAGTDAESVLVKPAEAISFILQEEYIAAFSAHLNELGGYVGNLQTTLRDVVRIVSVSIDNLNEPKVLQNKGVKSDTLALIAREITHIEEIYTELSQRKTHFFARIDYHLNDTFDKLDPYFVLKAAPSLQTRKRLKGRAAFAAKIRNKIRGKYRMAQAFFIKLRYGRSQGVLLAQKMQSSFPSQTTDNEQLIAFARHVTPTQSVQKSLPLYYRQLFLRERNTSKDLWLERKTQRRQITEVLQHHKTAQSGVLLVTGESGSGKTFLAEQIARTHSNAGETPYYTLNPPFRGSVSLRVFKSCLSRAVGISGEITDILDNIAQESVILIDDLELWWERSPKGLAVLDEIENMINRYSHKIFFILTIDKHAFNFISQVKNLNNWFFSIIESKAFSAEDLQKAILLRQRASRMGFALNNKPEAELSQWTLAGYFNYCFDVSEGNIGVALQTWISCIKKVEHNQISLVKKRKLSAEVFDKLQPDLIVVLVQCLLHKRMTTPKLARLMDWEALQTTAAVNTLKRCGLVDEKNGVMSVNRFVKPYLTKSFKKNNIL